MKKFSSWLVTHSLNGPLHVRSTMEREIDVATFAPNADGVELKHRSPAGLGEAAARADRGADPPTCALYSPADLPVGTRRRRGPYEDHGVAALYSPADLPVGTRRRRRPLGDDGAAAHNSIRHLRVALCTHQPTTPRTNGVAPLSCMADARGRSEGHSPLPLQQRLGTLTCCNPSP